MEIDQVVMGTAMTIELDPDPIFEQWILSGTPQARSKVVGRSADNACSVMVWECTAGSFHWHYKQDEALIVISGEAILLGENGQERRFAAGDYAFFPASTVAKWRVDNHIRKVALLREPVWRPVVPALKLWNKLVRKFRTAPQSRLARTSAQS